MSLCLLVNSSVYSHRTTHPNHNFQAAMSVLCLYYKRDWTQVARVHTSSDPELPKRYLFSQIGVISSRELRCSEVNVARS